MRKVIKFDYARWIFILPALIIVITISIYPIFSSLYYSFTTKHIIKPTYGFIGFKNYYDVLKDTQFF